MSTTNTQHFNESATNRSTSDGLRLLVLSLGGGAEVVKEMVEELEGRSFLGSVFPALNHHIVDLLRTIDRTACGLGHAAAVTYEQ